MKMTIQESQKSKIFFTADTHFSHANIIKYCNRPFGDAHEMNKALVNNWNSVVPQDGIVFHLGDFSMGDPERIIKRLNGEIVLVLGNHDRSSIKKSHLFKATCDMLDLTIKKDMFVVCCHYAMRTWNRSHFNCPHLFGHSHGTLPPVGKSWDVGVDNNNFTPLSIYNVERIINSRPDNENFLGNRKQRQ